MTFPDYFFNNISLLYLRFHRQSMSVHHRHKEQRNAAASAKKKDKIHGFIVFETVDHSFPFDDTII